MSGYTEMYNEMRDAALANRHCPAWAKNESRDVRVALAEGEVAKKELKELRDSLDCLRKLIEKR